ncbi:hypothetical protein EDD16DRAFT_1667418, partial [Pisolithus croceorrhizus]
MSAGVIMWAPRATLLPLLDWNSNLSEALSIMCVTRGLCVQVHTQGAARFFQAQDLNSPLLLVSARSRESPTQP